MKNALEMNIGGIKCDNPKCDFTDMSVQVEDYKQWLNKPCPECGENLLTEEDYRNTQFLVGLVELVNSIYPKVDNDEEVVVANINMNGTGEMKFKINNLEGDTNEN